MPIRQWPRCWTSSAGSGWRLPEALAAWAAAYASSQALAFLNGGRPEARRSDRWSCWRRTYTARLRFWPAHPNCGCSWLSPTEWGA